MLVLMCGCGYACVSRPCLTTADLLSATADVTKDGQLDSHEFAVAMHLIEETLAGKPIPSTLPPSLKPGAPAAAPAAPGAFGAPATAAPGFAPPPPPQQSFTVIPAYELQKPVEIIMQEVMQLGQSSVSRFSLSPWDESGGVSNPLCGSVSDQRQLSLSYVLFVDARHVLPLSCV